MQLAIFKLYLKTSKWIYLFMTPQKSDNESIASSSTSRIENHSQYIQDNANTKISKYKIH